MAGALCARAAEPQIIRTRRQIHAEAVLFITSFGVYSIGMRAEAASMVNSCRPESKRDSGIRNRGPWGRETILERVRRTARSGRGGAVMKTVQDPANGREAQDDRTLLVRGPTTQ